MPDALERRPAPVLVLGLGNLLLRDDGAGLVLLDRLHATLPADPRVEFIDGGTQGLAILPYLAERRAALVLDAVALGDRPGEVHVIEDARAWAAPRGTSAHESNASDLLAAAELIGDCPPLVIIVGVEPAEVRTGIGLSGVVDRALPAAREAAARALAGLLEGIDAEATACTR